MMLKTTEIYKSEQAARRAHELYRDYLSTWPTAYTEHMLSTRSGDTFVIESGPTSAPAVVLLHGTMATAAMWREEMATLAKSFHVFAVDIIGDAGFSAPIRPPTASDGHALWLLDVLKALGLAEAHIVGLSFGGWLALDFAAKFPQHVSSLTLITPGGVADKNVILWALPLLLLGPWGAERVQARILGPAPAMLTEHEAKLAAFSKAIFEGMRPRTERMTPISESEFAALSMPILVLLGADDVTMDSSEIARRFRRFTPHAEVIVLPGKRHFLGNQAEVIEAFLHNASGAEN